MNTITRAKEMDGKWTVRVNGQFVADYWFEFRPRRLAMNLQEALR